MAGLLQTVFIIFSMLFSPACGYLGDRYNRKWIMVAGILVWVMAVFASTFVPADKFWLFLLMRGIVGVGEASYAVVSPSLIGDLYSGKTRSRMLMLFYFAIPFGSGIGYVIGAQLSAAFGRWEWGMRLTPFFGAICVILIVLFVFEPERGLADEGAKAEKTLAEHTLSVVEPPEEGGNLLGYLNDLKTLVKNPTYLFSTFGYTALVFVTGTLSWWVPTAMSHAKAHELGLNSTDSLADTYKKDIALKFGTVTIAGGIVGVCAGSLLSELLRTGRLCFRLCRTARADPIISDKFLGCFLWSEFDGMAAMDAYNVLPEAQRRGVGRGLWDYTMVRSVPPNLTRAMRAIPEHLERYLKLGWPHRGPVQYEMYCSPAELKATCSSVLAMCQASGSGEFVEIQRLDKKARLHVHFTDTTTGFYTMLPLLEKCTQRRREFYATTLYDRPYRNPVDTDLVYVIHDNFLHFDM
ncbi:unnamed protein product, partial [Mesorhabditis spiculigera]